MHVIVLPNNWTETTEAYKVRKQRVLDAIAFDMSSAKEKPDLVVKVSAISPTMNRVTLVIAASIATNVPPIVSNVMP